MKPILLHEKGMKQEWQKRIISASGNKSEMLALCKSSKGQKEK